MVHALQIGNETRRLDLCPSRAAVAHGDWRPKVRSREPTYGVMALAGRTKMIQAGTDMPLDVPKTERRREERDQRAG